MEHFQRLFVCVARYASALVGPTCLKKKGEAQQDDKN